MSGATEATTEKDYMFCPLYLGVQKNGRWCIKSTGDIPVAYCPDMAPRVHATLANAERIVECVNGCDGIEHPKLLLPVLSFLGRLAEQADPEFDNRDAGPCDEAGALLRALRGTF